LGRGAVVDSFTSFEANSVSNEGRA
jgi:hypothetical protein